MTTTPTPYCGKHSRYYHVCKPCQDARKAWATTTAPARPECGTCRCYADRPCSCARCCTLHPAAKPAAVPAVSAAPLADYTDTIPAAWRRACDAPDDSPRAYPPARTPKVGVTSWSVSL